MYHIDTDKFADCHISVRSLFALDENTITAWNLLLVMMRSRTQQFPTKEALTKALNGAYAAQPRHSLTGIGTQVCKETRLTFLKPGLTADSQYEDKIALLLDQILHHPILDEKGLEEAKYLLKAHLMDLQEDPDWLAARMAVKAAADGHPFAICLQGRLEEVDRITLEDIQNLWNLIQETPRQVITIGAIPEIIQKQLEAISQQEASLSPLQLLPAGTCRKTEQEKAISQTSLVQVYATGIGPDSPLYTPLCVLNILLGQGESSLLFEEVREKHSCCYGISTTLVAYDGVLLVTCGTSRNHIPLVESLIQTQINRLKTGDFSEERLKMARLELEDRLWSGQDNPSALLEREYRQAVRHKRTSLERRLEKIRKVTKKDIETCARNLALCGQGQVMEDEA